jgi:hypothetical protein
MKGTEMTFIDHEAAREIAAGVILRLANDTHDQAIQDGIDASPGEPHLDDDQREAMFDAVQQLCDDAIVTVTWPDSDRIWELSPHEAPEGVSLVGDGVYRLRLASRPA